MKIDDFTHCQSAALSQYAGKLASLYPEDPIQALFCDEVMDTLSEMSTKAPRSKDPDEFKKLREEYQNTVMTKTAKFVEHIIQTNGGGKYVCRAPSVADLLVKGSVETLKSGMFDHVNKDFFDDYPGIVECAKSISEHPGVKAYYASKE